MDKRGPTGEVTVDSTKRRARNHINIIVAVATISLKKTEKQTERMPLNTTQRKTLRDSLRLFVDMLIDKRMNEWLTRVIAPVTLDSNQVVSILRHQKELIDMNKQAINIPDEIKNDLSLLSYHLFTKEDAPTIPESLYLKLEPYPNYNPYNMASMLQFEESVSSLDYDIKTALVSLRELFLEMTPLVQDCYGPNYCTFRYRIGEVPFNLNKIGERPLPGEIRDEVSEYITERLELDDSYRQQMSRLEREVESKTIEIKHFQIQQDELKEKIAVMKRKGVVTSNRTTVRSYLYSNYHHHNNSSHLQQLQQPHQQQQQQQQQQNNTSYITRYIDRLLNKESQGGADRQCSLAICYQYGLQGKEQNWSEALMLYEKAAKQGHYVAHLQLESHYLSRLDSSPVNLTMAQHHNKCRHEILNDHKKQLLRSRYFDLSFTSLERAANAGHVTCQTNLGECYMNGIGVTRNYKTAVLWFEKAAMAGCVIAQRNLGLCYTLGHGVQQNMCRAATWFDRAATQGDTEAQFRLGTMYEKGEGVLLDVTVAVDWYRKASDKGHTMAQCCLAHCYSLGIGGMEKDLSMAAVLYEKAAGAGLAEAQFILGGCYQLGHGVAQCNSMAVYWLQKAAEQEHAAAQYQIGMHYQVGDGLEQNWDLAASFFMKAAQQGHASAQCKLALCYRSGRGVPCNHKTALKWFHKSAAQHNADAQFHIGLYHYQGRSVFKNEVIAAAWFEKASHQGHDSAQYHLGYCYLQGRGVMQSDRMAFKLFESAAAKGHTDAQCRLAACYRSGRGVVLDHSKALYWFQRAASQGSAEAKSSLRLYQTFPVTV